eukprot:2681906-Rhodomonas_salina.1
MSGLCATGRRSASSFARFRVLRSAPFSACNPRPQLRTPHGAREARARRAPCRGGRRGWGSRGCTRGCL